MTSKEIEEFYKGDIPLTSDADLPPTFNEELERKRTEEWLVIERLDFQLSYFYREMNETVNQLGLRNTHFSVAHGMHHFDNYSTALDIALLSKAALAKHPFLEEICNTKSFKVPSRLRHGHNYVWKNTNYMLWAHDPMGTFSGIKTGVTPSAGPCLAVCFKSRCGTYDFIIVVMNCKSREARFIEIPKLVRWSMNRINKVKNSNLRPGIKRRLLRNMAHV